MIFSILLTLFVVVPIAELAILLWVGSQLGAVTAFGLVILTGVLGAWLARWQGLFVVMAIRRDLAEGRMPAPRLLDGVLILLAAAFMVTPGFITDTAGFLLLIPFCRRALKVFLQRWIEKKLNTGTIDVTYWEW